MEREGRRGKKAERGGEEGGSLYRRTDDVQLRLRLERRPSYKERRPSRVTAVSEYSGGGNIYMHFIASLEAEVMETAAASARVLARRRASERRRRAVSDSGVGLVIQLATKVEDSDEGHIVLRHKRRFTDVLEGCVRLQPVCLASVLTILKMQMFTL